MPNAPSTAKNVLALPGAAEGSLGKCSYYRRSCPDSWNTAACIGDLTALLIDRAERNLV